MAEAHKSKVALPSVVKNNKKVLDILKGSRKDRLIDMELVKFLLLSKDAKAQYSEGIRVKLDLPLSRKEVRHILYKVDRKKPLYSSDYDVPKEVIEYILKKLGISYSVEEGGNVALSAKEMINFKLLRHENQVYGADTTPEIEENYRANLRVLKTFADHNGKWKIDLISNLLQLEDRKKTVSNGKPLNIEDVIAMLEGTRDKLSVREIISKYKLSRSTSYVHSTLGDLGLLTYDKRKLRGRPLEYQQKLLRKAVLEYDKPRVEIKKERKVKNAGGRKFDAAKRERLDALYNAKIWKSKASLAKAAHCSMRLVNDWLKETGFEKPKTISSKQEERLRYAFTVLHYGAKRAGKYAGDVNYCTARYWRIKNNISALKSGGQKVPSKRGN